MRLYSLLKSAEECPSHVATFGSLVYLLYNFVDKVDHEFIGMNGELIARGYSSDRSCFGSLELSVGFVRPALHSLSRVLQSALMVKVLPS